MRIFLIVTAAVASAMLLSACGGDSKPGVINFDDQPEPRTPLASPTAFSASSASRTAGGTIVASPVASATAAPGAAAEVTGIVGGINASTRAIEIRPLRGASVTKIEVGDATKIRKAAGGTIPLADVRVSDRIIATGALNDRKDALVATEITVQDVVPGAQPGG